MAATALIKITQSGITFPSGRAALGAVGNQVDIECDDLTDIQSWRIDLVYTIPGSTVLPQTLASADSATPSGNFIPDRIGAYRVVLTVWESTGEAGASDVDIRDFVVPDPRYGFVFPPYQTLPEKRPILGSGLPGEKPDELNVRDNPFGWDGDGNDGLMLDVLQQLANSPFDRIPDPEQAVVGETLVVNLTALSQLRTAVTDTKRVFVIEQSRIIKGNQSGMRDCLTVEVTDAMESAVFDGDSVWIGGAGASDPVMQRIDGIKTTMALGTRSELVGYGSGQINDLAYDGQDLWAAADGDRLTRLNKQTGAISASITPAGGGDITAVVFDGDTTNYPSSGVGDRTKIWVLAGVNNATLYRVSLITPAVDGSVAVMATGGTGDFNALAVGNGWIWYATESGGNVILRRVNPDAVMIDVSSLDLTTTHGFDAVAAVEYDALRNYICVLGKDSSDNALYIEVDASTVGVVGSVQALSAGGYSNFDNNHFVPHTLTTPLGPSSGSHTGVGGGWIALGDSVDELRHVQAQQTPVSILVPAVQRYITQAGGVLTSAGILESAVGFYTVPAPTAVGELVYITGADAADQADNSAVGTTPVAGIIVAKPTGVTATIAYAGEITGLAGMTPGAIQYLGTSGALIEEGALPTAAGSVVQQVGKAISATRLLLAIEQPVTL